MLSIPLMTRLVTKRLGLVTFFLLTFHIEPCRVSSIAKTMSRPRERYLLKQQTQLMCA